MGGGESPSQQQVVLTEGHCPLCEHILTINKVSKSTREKDRGSKLVCTCCHGESAFHGSGIFTSSCMGFTQSNLDVELTQLLRKTLSLIQVCTSFIAPPKMPAFVSVCFNLKQPHMTGNTSKIYRRNSKVTFLIQHNCSCHGGLSYLKVAKEQCFMERHHHVYYRSLPPYFGP